MVKRKRRVCALLLSAALAVVQFPSAAMAENREPEDGSIASFEALDSEVKMQTVMVGTELSELKLPDTVKAKIYHVFQDTVIPEEEDTETDEDSSAATPGEAEKKGTRGKSADFREDDRVKTITKVTVSAEKIPVTWDSDPVYDSHMEGSYRFTADVGSYILSDGVKLPAITVTVKQGIPEQPIEQPAEKPIQKPTDNKATCTLTEGCTLLDGHEGGCIPSADNSLIKTITSWTFVDDGALDEGELALPGINKENQVDFAQVVKLLPTQIRAVVEGREAAELLDITGWNCPEYIREGGNWPFSGDYTFTAELPEGYVCAQQPSVKVLLGGANTYGINNKLTEGGLTIEASNGGEVEFVDVTGSTDGIGFILKEDGHYEIFGTWTRRLTTGDSLTKIIKVPSGVTANVTLNGVTIDTDMGSPFFVESGGKANIMLRNKNVLASSQFCSGIGVSGNAELTINGEAAAELEARGGPNSAGIGRHYQSMEIGTITINSGTVTAIGQGHGSGIGTGAVYAYYGGTITITGGIVNAISTNGAGIGGGDDCQVSIEGGKVTARSVSGAGIGGGGADGSKAGTGGKITITGGIVTASSTKGAGIGGGYSADADESKIGYSGHITIEGDTVVFASHIGNGNGSSGSKKDVKLNEGVIFMGNTGMVYGNPTLQNDLTLPGNYTLTVPKDSSLTIPEGIRLVNNSAIDNQGTITNQGNVTNQGTITNQGSISNQGSITGNQPIGGGTLKDASTTAVTFAVKENGSYGNQTATAVAGETVKITATAQKKSANGLQRNAAQGEVDFYIGTIHPDHKLGTAAVKTDSGSSTASIEITLSGEDWNKGFAIGQNTITVDFGGMDNLLDSTGSAVLTISRVTPSLTLTAEPKNSLVLPGEVILTAALTDAYPGNAGKKISFTVNGGNIATVITDSYGKATCTITGLAKGTYNFGAFFGGDTENERVSAAEIISYGVSSSGSNSSSRSSSSGDSGGSYSNTSILQGTWVQTDTGIWKFRRTNGSYAKNQWGISDGLWYYFGSDGQLLTGWQFLNSQWYYLCTDETAKVRDGMKEGAMASGWYYDLFYQNWFYLDENGAMVTGWREIDGTQYYFNPVSDGQKGILTETSEKQP